MRRALLGFGFLALAACSATADDDPPSIVEVRTCETVGTQRLAANRIALNKIGLNGVATNRISLNRIALNRIALNRLAANRLAANRIALNRIALNRIALNGSGLEGVANNEIVGITDQGEVLDGEKFVGATVTGVLTDGSTVDLDITSFARTEDPAIVHYGLAYQGKNICADENVTGMFVPGIWDETGKHIEHVEADGKDVLTVSYACNDGVIAKCATWGYASWKAGADLHAACTRMGTADYCGDGVSYTKDGMTIDMFDHSGINVASTEDASLLFEAAWTRNGATCVSRPRYDAHGAKTGSKILPSCWATLPTCTGMTDAAAANALIGNASRPQSRELCE